METANELTTTEAAALKGVTRAAVHLAIREGRLRARAQRKPGHARGTWLIRREDLSEWRPITDPRERARHAAAERRAAEDAEARRKAAARAAYGSTAHLGGPTLADFLREKHEETERDLW